MRPLVLLSSLADGGAERVTVSFLERLLEQGRPVPLCTLTDRRDGVLAADLARSGVRRIDLGATRLADPAAALRYARLLRAERIDVVHAHGQDAAILAAARRALGGARLAITRHVLEEPAPTWRARVRARVERWAMRRADAVVAVSQAAADALPRLEAGRLVVMPNGIALARFAPRDRPDERARLRRALGLASGDIAVLCVAVLREGKGHETLIDAVARLRSDGAPVRLLLAGAGPTEGRLKPLAASLGSAASFLGARSDIPDLLEACDVVALASHAEALPTALIEAAAAGRPVVGTRVGGTPEVVAEGETGLLVPPGDAAALAQALGRLAGDALLRERLGAAARERALRLFALERQVDATWRLWERLAG